MKEDKARIFVGPSQQTDPSSHALKNKRKYPQKSTSMCDFFRQSIHSETLENKNLLLENFTRQSLPSYRQHSDYEETQYD